MSSPARNQQGFTIVELMIATAVLATLLVIVTSAITGVGNLYFKAVNQSQIQSSVRTLSEDIASRIKFSSGSVVVASPVGDRRAYCIGNTRYSYILSTQRSDAVPHILWRDQVSAGSCVPADLTLANPSSPATNGGTNGVELSAPRSRLSEFTIGPTAPHAVRINLVAGPEDLLCSPTAVDANACGASGTMTAADYQKTDLRCKASSSSKFCAAARQETIVVQRL